MKNFIYIFLHFTISMAQVNVNLESIPIGVTIIIDSKPAGVTPQYNLQLTPGIHSIELSKENFVPIKWKTVLQEAVKAELSFRMKAIHEIRFISKENGLRFQFDGQAIWSDKRVILKLEEGEHDLVVFKAGAIVDQKSVIISEPTKIIYSLK